MRRVSPLVIAVALALTGAGCASSPESLSGSGTGGGSGGGGGGSLGAGDTSIVVTSSGRSPATGGVTQVRFSNVGSDESELATVTVDPRNGSGSTRQAAMNVYLRQNELGAQYTEYRTVTSSTDDELQLWQYGSSYAAQYRDVKSGLSSWFFNGTRTEAPSGAATYAGQYTAGMKTSNFIRGENDEYDPNGEWRIVGDANLSANYATGQFNGTLSAPTYWEKYEGGDVYSSVTNAPENGFQVTGYQLRGTVDGNRISGTTCYSACGLGGASNANNQMFGGVFGTNADEITGVFGTLATIPLPTGGNTAINDDRRAFIDTQGMFHGQRQ